MVLAWVFLEVANKMLAGQVSSEGLTVAGRSASKMAHSHSRQGGALSAVKHSHDYRVGTSVSFNMGWSK